uniref:Nucleoporin Nup133/Nup155-like C-terminal domain-containing protein n=1 Tax=Ditylenchus dipsaci TaxID=166011 RepID=A0A915ELW5_9BILA
MQSGGTNPVVKEITILDVAVYCKGILVLIAAVKHGQVELFLGYLEDKREPSSIFEVLVPILLPESMAELDSRKLSKCQILVPNSYECVVVLPKSLILIRHPTTQNVHAAILENIDDVLLGASCVNGLCHVVLKESGVCALRRLPKAFDLSFWERYGDGLESLISEPFSDDLFKQAFAVFCSKDLADSQDMVNELLKKTDINYSELAVELIKYFSDRIPLDDPRWSSEGLFLKDQRPWLEEHSKSKNLPLIVEHLDDKLSHYRMFVLFLQHFKLIDKLDRPVESMYSRSGLALLAEYGEKIFLMMLCAKWLSENSTPIISQSFKALASEFIRRFNHPENEYLTHFDHVFNEVSCFHELIPAVVKSSEKELKELNQNSDNYERVITEVSAFLGVLAEGIIGIREQDWSLQVPKTIPTWLNHSHFLIYFIRHLNAVLDFMANKYGDNDISFDSPLILEQSVRLARFVLSQQTRWQRDNSKIIAKYCEIGKVEVALNLAEEFQDFTMLIEYCHKNLNEKECQRTLDAYKKKYSVDDFDLFLYEYYREKGMVNYLLAEKGNRVNDFLSAHESINWIKNVENCEYSKARKTLKAMAYETRDAAKKLTELSLCKLCVLCEDKVDVAELADLSENIRALSQSGE